MILTSQNGDLISATQRVLLFLHFLVLTYPKLVNAKTNARLSGASIYIQTRRKPEDREGEKEMKGGKITKND